MAHVTLEDVARVAGVSISTASRALSGNPKISRQTAARVQAAAQQLGYRPNLQARSLSVQRTHNIGMIIANPVGSTLTSDHFFFSVVEGASRVLEKLGLNLVVSTSQATYQSRADLPQMIRDGRVDGVILGGIPMQDSFVRAVARAGLPTVFIGRYLDRGDYLNTVTPDNVEGGRVALEYLLGLGHHTIAVVSGPLEINTFKDRLAGAQVAAGEANGPARLLSVVSSPVVCSAFDEAAGYQAVRGLLQQSSQPPTAILGLTDWLALGAIRALREGGLAVPGDVSVMGFSDIALATASDPPLTTVRVSSANLGALAARLVLDLLSGEVQGPVKIVLPPELVVRASCAPPRQGSGYALASAPVTGGASQAAYDTAR